MRRVTRLALGPASVRWLRRNQDALDSDLTIDVVRRWTDRRKTMNGNGIVITLQVMAGKRRRCMYCGDSEGCDIEHYYPKSRPEWRGSAFQWENFLWVCAPCNRLKNTSFGLTSEGVPVLLNPCEDSPWEYFDYVEQSGQLVARYGLVPPAAERACGTLDERMSRALCEVVCNGRQRTSRHLRRAVSSFMKSPKDNLAREDFLDYILDLDYPELCEWYFERIGSSEEPFAEFSRRHPDVIAQLRERLIVAYPGVW